MQQLHKITRSAFVSFCLTASALFMCLAVSGHQGNKANLLEAQQVEETPAYQNFEPRILESVSVRLSDLFKKPRVGLNPQWKRVPKKLERSVPNEVGVQDLYAQIAFLKSKLSIDQETLVASRAASGGWNEKASQLEQQLSLEKVANALLAEENASLTLALESAKMQMVSQQQTLVEQKQELKVQLDKVEAMAFDFQQAIGVSDELDELLRTSQNMVQQIANNKKGRFPPILR